MPSVAVLVGSLRRESVNRRLAKALAKLAPPNMEFRFIEIGDLPHYNEDLWANPPQAVVRFKAEVAACDGVLMVTPEYNRGVPGVLKNAFDWGTRPWGQNLWAGKPGAITGASIGAVGTAVAQGQMRNTLVVLGVILMGQPELYFHFKPDLIDEHGEVSDEATRSFLSAWALALQKWIVRMQNNAP